MVKFLGKTKAPFAVFAVVGALLVGLSGCAAPTAPDKDTKASKGSSEVAESAVDKNCDPDGDTVWGDVVPKETVEDEFGKYCHVTINPDADALVYDASKVDTVSLAEFGFTEDEAATAQKNAVALFVENTLDSSRLDNFSVNSVDWFEKNGPSFMEPDTFTLYSDALKSYTGSAESLGAYGIVVTDFLPEPLKRDGGFRGDNIDVKVSRIYATQVEGADQPVLVVEIDSSNVYTVPDESVIGLRIKLNSAKGMEYLKKNNPELFDEDTETKLIVNSNSLTAFNKGNLELFAGLSTQFKLTSMNETLFTNG